MMYNIRSDAIRYMTSYLMAIVMFALSLTFYEIFANKEKCLNCGLENEGKVKEQKNGACAIQIEIFESI